MRVQLNFEVSLRFQTGYQFKRMVRSQDTGHVFNGNGVRAHVFDALGQINPRIQSVYRAGRIRQRTLWSDMTILKAIEAGIDRVDTAISSMSMTYGHTATESVVAAMAGTDRDTV